MNPDKYQQAWKADAARTHVTIDAGLLSKEVQRFHRDFQATIFWRDVREAGTSLLMIPIWFAMGILLSLPWTWYLTVPALIWVAGLLLVDRRRHPQRTSDPGEPLLFYVKESLAQVEHQIWLLRNVFWWYLLPFSLSIMAFFLQVAWNTSGGGWGFVLVVAFLGLFLFVIYGGTYRLNQRAVRNQLEPRRQDLLKLVASLEGEASSEDSGDLMELVSALADPIPNCGLSSNWAENWNRIVPSWRIAAVIILPTLGGALCGLFSGLHFQIRDMGPTLFQTVVGAVIPFEIALGLVWRRSRKKQRQFALTDHESNAPASKVALDDSTNKKPKLLPRAPAIVIIFLILFLSVMAVVAITSCVTHLRGDSASRDAHRPTEPDFADVSAFDDRDITRVDAWQQQVDLAKYPSLTVAIVRWASNRLSRSTMPHSCSMRLSAAAPIQGHRSGSGETLGGNEKPVPTTTRRTSIHRLARSAVGECSQTTTLGPTSSNKLRHATTSDRSWCSSPKPTCSSTCAKLHSRFVACVGLAPRHGACRDFTAAFCSTCCAVATSRAAKYTWYPRLTSPADSGASFAQWPSPPPSSHARSTIAFVNQKIRPDCFRSLPRPRPEY